MTATKTIGKIAEKSAPKGFGTLLDAIEILEADSVPSYHAYPWYSKTFTAMEKDQEKGLEGVEFSIDRRAFKNLGNRITGSLGLMFICKLERKSQRHLPIRLEARARLSFRPTRTGKMKRTEMWIPKKRGTGEETQFVEPLFLEITPKPVKTK